MEKVYGHKEMNRQKQMIFLSISMQVFYPNVCLLGRSFVYRSYYAFNTWYCQNLGWLNFSDSYLSLYGFTALLIYLAYFYFIDEIQSWSNDWENDLLVFESSALMRRRT